MRVDSQAADPMGMLRQTLTPQKKVKKEKINQIYRAGAMLLKPESDFPEPEPLKILSLVKNYNYK